MDAILIDGKGESRVVGSPMPHSNDIIYKDDEHGTGKQIQSGNKC